MRKWKQLGFNVIKDSFDQLPTAVCFLTLLGGLYFAIDRCIG